jgi:hypothetical protein
MIDGLFGAVLSGVILIIVGFGLIGIGSGFFSSFAGMNQTLPAAQAANDFGIGFIIGGIVSIAVGAIIIVKSLGSGGAGRYGGGY